MSKPRLSKWKDSAYWVCQNLDVLALGHTPELAYLLWEWQMEHRSEPAVL